MRSVHAGAGISAHGGHVLRERRESFAQISRASYWRNEIAGRRTSRAFLSGIEITRIYMGTVASGHLPSPLMCGQQKCFARLVGVLAAQLQHEFKGSSWLWGECMATRMLRFGK